MISQPLVFSPSFQADRREAARPTIEVISTEAGLAALAGIWEGLLASSAAPNPFLSWEWLSVWYRHFAKGKALEVLLVLEEGRPIGIAPFYRTTKNLLGVPFRKLSLLGEGEVGSDHLDLISEKGAEEKVARAVARRLMEAPREWDLLDLRDVAERSLHLPFLIEAFEKNRWTVWKEPGEVCPYLPLAPTWDDTLNRLSASMRYTVRRKLRNIEKEGSVEFVAVEAPEAGEAEMETLIDLHQKRWDSRGGSDAFVTEIKSRFHREVARSFFEKGIARLFLLKIDRKTVASLYGFLMGNRFFYYQAGFDPALKDKSVGMALMAKSLQAAIARGWEEFDFLRGTEGYKFHWTSAQRRLWNLSVFPPGVKSSVYQNLFSARQGMKRVVKKLLRGRGPAVGGREEQAGAGAAKIGGPGKEAA